MNMDGSVYTRLLLFVILATIVCSQTLDDCDNLISHLTSNYNKQVRPVSNQQDTLYVNVTFELGNILSFDDVEGKLTFVGGLYMFWTDIRMQWNESLYNGSSTVYLLSGDVWVPELILLTPVESVEKMPQDWTSVRFYSNGLAVTGSAYVFKISCSVNIKYYPFDKQTCFLGVTPNRYTSTELMIRSINNHAGTSFYTENGEWDLISTEAFTNVANSGSLFQLKLVLQRRALFVVLIVILPIMLLSLLNILAFLMPPEERSGFTVTMLLAMAVFLTIISDNIPKTSSPLAIVCYFIGVQVLLSALICCGTILNLRVFHRDSSESIPSWILYLTFSRRGCSGSTASSIVAPNPTDLTTGGKQATCDVSSLTEKSRDGLINDQDDFVCNEAPTPTDLTTGGKQATCDVASLTQTSRDGLINEQDGSVCNEDAISWQQVSARLDYIFILVSLIYFVINWAVFFLCVTFKDNSEHVENLWD